MEIETARHWLERSFEELAGRSNGSAETWGPLRSAAFERFAEMGFPTTGDEDWKYTSVNELAKSEFRLAQPGSVTGAELEPYVANGADPYLLVFVNGRFEEAHSCQEGLPAGVTVRTLSSAAHATDNDRALLKKYLGSCVGGDTAVSALNTALLQEGAFIRIGRGVQLERPLQLLFISTHGAERAVIPSRVLILSEANSAASVIETYAGLGADPYLTSAVFEAVVEEGAWLEHTKLGLEGPKAYHLSLAGYQLAKSSRLAANVFNFGGRLVRNEFRPVLDGEGIEAFLNGLTVIGGSQHVDNSLFIEHAKPNCFSREIFKGIYGGKSTGVFSGTIQVHQDAQKTNAVQSNQSLLLSADASVNTRPQLKIFADDVKCTHGATVGQLDEEALFYMRSRGVSKEDARNLLIHAFAGDVITHVSIDPLKEMLEELLLKALKISAS